MHIEFLRDEPTPPPIKEVTITLPAAEARELREALGKLPYAPNSVHNRVYTNLSPVANA